MTGKKFKHILKEGFEKKLPGFSSQLKMAPKGRHNAHDLTKVNDAKKSAVLILVYRQNGDLLIPFIKRVSDGSMHSGQIAFPGGKFEPWDIDLTGTALREAYEEVGIQKEYVEVLKELTPLYIPVSNFLVQPIVAFSDIQPDFRIAEDEVEQLYTIKLYDLLNAEVVNKTFQVKEHFISAPFFIIKDIEIWGATAMILSEFVDVLKDVFRN